MSNKNTQKLGPCIRNLRFHIGQNIHRRRSTLKIPLTKLSELTGFSPQRLDHYEMGRYEIELGELLKIAKALQVQVKELL